MSNDHRRPDLSAENMARILDILTDPRSVEELRKYREFLLQDERRKQKIRVEYEDPYAGKHTTIRGTCPTCGKKYVVSNKTGVLRKHGEGKCALYNQLPREVIQAIWVIADMGSDDDREGTGEG